MDLSEALRTTGAVREFRSDPVPAEVIARVLDVARFAPSGGNRQAWRVVIVGDPALRRAMRDLYLPGWYEYLAQRAAGLTPWAPVTDEAAETAAVTRAPEAAAEAAAGPGGFAEHFDTVPVMLALFADLSAVAAVDKGFARYTFVAGASVYPFAWNLLLAARDEGLGGVVTTMNVRREPEVRTLLGVPEQFALGAVIALGWPERRPTRLSRQPVSSFTTIDRFDGPAFAAL